MKVQFFLRKKAKLLRVCVSTIQLLFYVVIQTHAAVLHNQFHIFLALIRAVLANVDGLVG